MNQRKKKILVLLIIVLFVSVEILLRKKYGFCDAVLMQEDINSEYIAQPNQNRRRFGNFIHYNEYSMRSESIDTSATIILGFGDSIINRGTLSDQDSLAATRLSDSLTLKKLKKFQVLNISAGSWGPDNCAAYLFNKGNFAAKFAFLVVSSHDAFDNMNFEKIVGKDPSFQNTQYKMAIVELFDRYLIPRTKELFLSQEEDEFEINKEGINFNKGFQLLYSYFKNRNIPFFIYLHSEIVEQEKKEYNSHGQLIITFCQKNNIKLVTDLNLIQKSDYRDNIHLNDNGQKKMFKLLLKQIDESIKKAEPVAQN